MMDAHSLTRPRRRNLWLPDSRVPRPFDKWLYEILKGPRWRNHRLPIPWLAVARGIGDEHGCRIVCDTSRHWMESVYVRCYRKRGPAVLLGAVGDPLDVCSALLHELGHHILVVRDQHSSRTLAGETAAWGVAHELAAKYRLPLNPKVRRTALYSYRYAQHLATVQGSKARTRRRPAPHSWRLETSKRSAAISTGPGLFSTGKKGKREAKKFIKKSTVRAERRRRSDWRSE